MKYLKGRRWVNGITYGEPAYASISELHQDVPLESTDEQHDDIVASSRDACECFCEEFCRRFCPEFCRNFCSDVRDDVCAENRGEVGRRGRCCRREGCREVACRACHRVFVQMGRVCPGNFCRCFSEDFCRAFCREFECVRRQLCESHHGRSAICCEGCREICCRVCPPVCRRHSHLVPLV